MLFTCYEEDEIQKRLGETGFKQVEFVTPPESAIYKNMPRLVDRGISGYLVFSYR